MELFHMNGVLGDKCVLMALEYYVLYLYIKEIKESFTLILKKMHTRQERNKKK